MEERALNLKDQLLKFWAGLTRAKQIALVSVTATVLLGVIAVSVLGSRIQYVDLYAGLNTEDSASIAAKLTEMKVSHRVTFRGVQVPDSQVHELRLQLAAEGLPRGGGVGFEIFDTSRLGATEFEQKINLRRALEGELARSISTINGVRSARVHLVLPERRLFAARSEGASASVVVKLQSGYNFGRREVAGVVHLVSAAVPALSKERISLVSTEGITLHRPDSEGTLGGLGLEESQSQAARELASSMETHVRTLLERITGPGGVDVRINIDLEKSTRERTEEHYDPTATALRSEHKTEEATRQEGATVAGVPGAQTNLPDVEESVASSSDDLGGDIVRRSRTRNWEVDRITEKIVTPSGQVSRISAAVLIDGTYIEKDGVAVYEPRAPEQLKRLESIVKNAIGFNEERGDSIQIEGAKFATMQTPEVETDIWTLYERYLPYVLTALGILTLFVMFLVFMRAVKTQGAPVEPDHAAEQLTAAHEGAIRGELAQELEEEVQPETPTDPALLEQNRAAALQIATNDPATAAIVLKGWLDTGIASSKSESAQEKT